MARDDDGWGPYDSEWMRSRRRKWGYRFVWIGYAASFALILTGFILKAAGV